MGFSVFNHKRLNSTTNMNALSGDASSELQDKNSDWLIVGVRPPVTISAAPS